jgi:hypothetical protein
MNIISQKQSKFMVSVADTEGRGLGFFSWAMSHICANDEYQSQVGATKRPENIVIRYVSFVTLLSICILVPQNSRNNSMGQCQFMLDLNIWGRKRCSFDIVYFKY